MPLVYADETRLARMGYRFERLEHVGSSRGLRDVRARWEAVRDDAPADELDEHHEAEE